MRDADARQRTAEAALARRQSEVGRLLAATYQSGAPGALRLALSGEDPGESARRLHYAALVSQAAARALDAHRARVAELGALRKAAREEAAALEAIEREQRSERGRLASERRERQKVMDRIAGELRRGRREMQLLQADEARLSRVIEEIARTLAARPVPPRAAAQRPAAMRAAPSPPAAPGREPAATLAPAAVDAFSALRGRLRPPVRGELVARFGAEGSKGRALRSGVFFRAAAGEPVRAIAGGRVVFADWMRGFGNLIIVDHGESYLSVYGNNEALLKRPGEAVAAGETLATAGATGGNEETGLYFELRHVGKAFDPMQWLGR